MAILRVDENDECEYTCKAENSAGEKACSANLHLIETPVGSKPQLYVFYFAHFPIKKTFSFKIRTEEIAPSFIRKLRNCTSN